MEERRRIIGKLLYSFGIPYEDLRGIEGATVTLFKFKPRIGVRISKIRNLKDEFAVALGLQSVRIIAPMADGSVGIEVPNKERKILHSEDVFNSWEYINTPMKLPLALGKTVKGEIFMADLTEMPHLLVAGATGQGKSVGLNVIIASLLNKLSPEEMRLVLIDPKQVEFGVYSELEQSYLVTPVITEMEEASRILKSLCELMEERYSMLREKCVRNISEYNALLSVEKMPYIVTVIDEYGDLVMQRGGREIEYSICRIAQKARAVGIHMVIATQRPDTKIITGTIKANFPTRISFRTTTGTDSRVVLDQMGAEKLTGKGDMLYFSGAETTRVQCAYTDISETKGLCERMRTKYPFVAKLELPQTSMQIPVSRGGVSQEEWQFLQEERLRILKRHEEEWKPKILAAEAERKKREGGC